MEFFAKGSTKMIHIDEQYKDASPQTTVERIYNLLEAQNIGIEEDWVESGIPDCFSVRVSITGTSLGTNGKGVTKELARASGCAELMERLQSGFRGAGSLRFPDEIPLTKQELTDRSLPVLSMLAAKIAADAQADFSVDQLLDHVYGFGTIKSVPAIPFFNANNGTSVYLPVSLIKSLYSSNGLAAGNSTEETVVQGFSEVVERHCQGRILRENLIPPTIPDSYLKQFGTAWNIICDLRKANYTVLIKDCSLGEGFPVVASVLIDKNRHGYRVIFGASPVFEIALERSLTEQLQGYNVGNIVLSSGFFTGTVRTASDFEAAFVAGHATYPIEFFEGEASYPFVPAEDLSNVTNKELLHFIMQYLQKHGRTMLVRDLSHFGFPTFRILVPGMSETSTAMYVGSPSYRRLCFDVGGAARNLPETSVPQLLSFIKRYNATPSVTSGPVPFSNLSGLPLEITANQDKFWGLISMAYANWSIGNAAQSAQYLTAALPYVPEDSKPLAECLDRYLTLRRSRKGKDQALAHLRLFYEADTVRQLQAALNEPNPFTVFLPCCKGHCSDCKIRNICKYPDYSVITKRLNEAASKFDIARSFAQLHESFDAVRS